MKSPRDMTLLRWCVRAVLALGVAASVAANVLHARPNPISQAIAGWPPVALLLTVELISRVPVGRRSVAALRITATTVIAGIAAWISYTHMVGATARYGETGATPYLLPLSVDGLIVVASICLVELSAEPRPAPSTALPPAPEATDPEEHPEPTTTTPSRPSRPGTTQPPTVKIAPPLTPGPPAAASADSAQPRTLSWPRTSDDGLYQPTSETDHAMYQTWLRTARAGREPTGTDLAKAAGRTDDSTGIGRRAARRYRNAHHPTNAQQPPRPTPDDPASQDRTHPRVRLTAA